MRKPITKKYYIESDLADILNTRVEVSKAKFEAALKAAELKFNNQEPAEDNEFYISRHEYTNETEQLIYKSISFGYSIDATSFTTVECKEGYRFTK